MPRWSQDAYHFPSSLDNCLKMQEQKGLVVNVHFGYAEQQLVFACSCCQSLS